MKAELINPFLNATKNVLETMCQTKVSSGKPILKSDSLTYGEVTGIIGMASKEIAGCMILSFSKQCILHIVANMLMEEAKKEIDDEIVDAVGELTNMICGGAKAKLSTLDYAFDMATPTMIVGTNIELKYYTNSPTIIIPFSTEYGKFVIEANLGTKK